MSTLFLLDVAAYDSFVFYGLLITILFLLGCVLIEAVAIKFLSKHTFKKSFSTSFFVNLITSIVGLIALPLLSNYEVVKELSKFGRLGILFVVTVILEALLLKLFLKNMSWNRNFLTSMVMNLLTYTILFFMLVYGK